MYNEKPLGDLYLMINVVSKMLDIVMYCLGIRQRQQPSYESGEHLKFEH